MKQFIKQLFIDAFGAYSAIATKRSSFRHEEQRRSRARFVLSQLLTLLALLLLGIASASARESDPKFKFNQPSDEMDFTLPPIADMPRGKDKKAVPDAAKSPAEDSTVPPPLYGFESVRDPEPQKENGDGEKKIDQFFSTTTVLSPDQIKDENSLEAVKPIADKTSKKQKKRKLVRAYPAHEFKSVRLPATIYHKKNTFENMSLPFAYMEEDQHLMLANAVTYGQIESARALYNNGARIDWRDAKGTPLIVLAAQHQQVNTARWLLQHRANPNDIDGSGLAALHYAAYSGNHEMVRLLLEFGAEKNLTDTRGKTPLLYAQLHPSSSHVVHMLSF